MGTRNLIAVVHDGEYKVAQYGQWDGYPTGQGVTVCEFLQGMDIGQFRQAVSECRFISDDELKSRWVECGADPNDSWVTFDVSERFGKKYPELSRDTGGRVLELIKNGVRELHNAIDFAGDSLFCEWAYVINLDNEMLEIYSGFNKNGINPNERFYGMHQDNEKYYPVKLYTEIPFSEATKAAMIDLMKKHDDELE